MERSSEKRRAWVKNAAIIFLTILLLLTFFSNTILTYSLPEVSAQYANSGTLTSAVKVDGTVKANESYSVVYEADQAEAENGVVQSRKVISVFVKEGDMVSKDAPILELQGGMSSELEAVKKEYDSLKREYDLALLQDTVDGLTSDKTISEAQKAIADAKKDLAELQEEYNAVLSGADTKTLIENRIERLEEELEAINENYEAVSEIISDLNSKKDTAEGMIEEDIFSNLTVAEKLEAAEEEFENAEYDYLNLKADVEFYSIRLEEKKNDSESLGEANTLTSQIDTLKDQLESLELERERYIEDYWDKNGDSIEDYQKLLQDYYDAEKQYDSFLAANQSEIDTYESLQYIAESANSVLADLNEKVQYHKNALQNYETAYDRWHNAISIGSSDEDKAILKEEVDRLDIILKGAEADLPTESELESAKASANEAASELSSVQELINKLDKYKAQLDSAKAAYESAELDDNITNDTAYNRKLEDYEDSINDLVDQIEELENKLYIIGMPEVDDLTNFAATHSLAEIQKLYDDASADLTEATAAYETAKKNVESLRKQNMASESLGEFETLLVTYEAELKTIEEAKKAKNKEIEAANKELSSASDSRDAETVAKDIEDKKANIASLETQLKITEATQSKSDAELKLNREDQLKKLNELSAKIETYTNAPTTTTVTAPVAGRIVSVNFVPGLTVTSGATVASIEIADQGYVCEISMSADEARKIQIGTPCTIVNNWWYNNIEASVTQIRPDPASQGKNRIVVIEVRGDVSEGQSLKFSIGDKSQSYDIVLPNSAIREDNDGKFVLAVEAKNSALGTKYTAKRIDIEVIASDDTRSAVSGLYGSEFIITGSQVPITDKQRVRLADNG